jgi:PEP-CTERM motif
MRYKPAVLFGIALFCLSANAARADHIAWAYSWSRSPEKVFADGSTTSYVALTSEAEVQAGDNTDVVAANLSVFSDAPDSAPAKFTDKPYTLTLTITDGDSAAAGSLAFTGEFNGRVTSHSSNVSIFFTGQNTQSLTLGQHLYTVTMDAYAPPGPPGSSNVGSIGAHAIVAVQTLPEPSTLFLAALALPAGVFWRRRRRK